VSITEASLWAGTSTSEVITLLASAGSGWTALSDLYDSDDAILIDDLTGSDALLSRSNALATLSEFRLCAILILI